MLRFEQLLNKVLGLNIASIGNSVIQRSVQDRIEANHLRSIDEYWTHISQSGDELQELIERIVVPETWFFRHPEAMTVLARLMTVDWPAERAGDVRRILSLPCATGEEPYSIAMTLTEAGLSRDKVVIDALDISRRSLLKAERGMYGSNSFRGEGAKFRDKYFDTLPGGGAELHKSIREWVRFAHSNIASSDFATPLKHYDAIFCRNLLIYLDAASQRGVLEKLNSLLVPDGYLFVGPAEAPLASEHGFVPLGHDMSFAYQKSSIPRIPSAVVVQPRKLTLENPKLVGKTKTKEIPLFRAEATQASRVPDRRTEQRSADPENDLDKAFRLADSGKLNEAVDACETYLKQHGTSATAFYLLGILRDSMGDIESAVACYRKALFLDPNHSDASAHLGMLVKRLGDDAGAKRLSARSKRSAGAQEDWSGRNGGAR